MERIESGIWINGEYRVSLVSPAGTIDKTGVWKHNLITTVGFNAIAKLISGEAPVSTMSIKYGDDNTAPAYSQTSLLSLLGSASASVQELDNQYFYMISLLSPSVGETIREIGTFVGIDMISRVAGAFEFTVPEEGWRYLVEWRYSFSIGTGNLCVTASKGFLLKMLNGSSLPVRVKLGISDQAFSPQDVDVISYVTYLETAVLTASGPNVALFGHILLPDYNGYVIKEAVVFFDDTPVVRIADLFWDNTSNPQSQYFCLGFNFFMYQQVI